MSEPIRSPSHRGLRPLLALALMLGAPLGANAQDSEGVRLFEAREYAAAKSYFERELATKADDADAMLYLARLAMIDNRESDAAKLLERAVVLRPTSSVHHMWLGRAYGRQAQRAGALSKLGLAKKTKSAMEKAVALDEHNLDAREDLMQYYAQAPGMAGGGKDKAYAQADEIARRDPVRGAIARGTLLEQDKKWADAERVYQEVLRTHPDTPNAELRLGWFYIRSEQYDKAFAQFDAMLRRNPNDLSALYQLGRTGAVSGRELERAAEALRRYIAANPEPSEVLPDAAAAHFRLGQVYEKLGDRARARTEYEQTVRSRPDHKEAKQGLKRVS